MHLRNLLLGIVLASLPLVAEAATPRTFKDLASLVYTVIMAGVATLIALAFVYYFWNIAYRIKEEGEGSYKIIRDYAGWGLVILFLMISIFGIVRIISSTFFQGSSSVPTSPGNARQTPSLLINDHVVPFHERDV